MCDGLLENRIDCEGNWITPTYSVVKCANDNYNENLNGSKHESKNKIWMERRMDQDIIFSVSRSLSLE